MTTISETWQPVADARKKYCSRALLLAVIIGFALIILGLRPLGKGLVLGSLFSVFNFWLMAHALPAKIAPGRARRIGVSLGSLFGRFALLAIPFGIALQSPAFHLAAVVAGVFMVQLVILTDHIVPPMIDRWSQNRVRR